MSDDAARGRFAKNGVYPAIVEDQGSVERTEEIIRLVWKIAIGKKEIL